MGGVLREQGVLSEPGQQHQESGRGRASHQSQLMADHEETMDLDFSAETHDTSLLARR